MIPKDKIDEVRDRASIVQVISEYIPLTKRGTNHVGLCPFHSEKTPSFTVSEEKKIFYCFGCNATGNAVTFVMKKEGVTFPEAIRMLARRYGVSIDEYRKTPDPRDVIYGALRSAAEYFFRELRGPEGARARDYLKKRGYEGDILKRFGVGYAPDRWDGLVKWLKAKEIPLEAAERAGLLGRKEKGFYDKFRGRIIFPIMDVRSKVIGFGGRAMDDRNQPKYLNSPETPVFKKGEVLYGLPQAKDALSKDGSAIVVEGYFDLLALHKHGFTNAVATMGTALTAEHVRALKGYAGTVYSLFDADQAGRNAAIRSLGLFTESEVTCRAIILEGAKDPDEFLAAKGPEAMRSAMGKAEPLMEFYLKDLGRKNDLTTPEGKRRFFSTAVDSISKVRNIAERGHYASTLAMMLGLSVESVHEAMKNGSLEPVAKPGGADKASDKGESLKELTILRVIVRHPEMFDEIVASAMESFRDPLLREAGLAISGALRQGKTLNVPELMESLSDEGVRGVVADLLFKEDDGFIESPGQMLEDSLKRVLNQGKIKESTREMIKRLEDMGRADVASEIIKRIGRGASARRH